MLGTLGKSSYQCSPQSPYPEYRKQKSFLQSLPSLLWKDSRVQTMIQIPRTHSWRIPDQYEKWLSTPLMMLALYQGKGKAVISISQSLSELLWKLQITPPTWKKTGPMCLNSPCQLPRTFKIPHFSPHPQQPLACFQGTLVTGMLEEILLKGPTVVIPECFHFQNLLCSLNESHPKRTLDMKVRGVMSMGCSLMS